jgi:membrane-associated phospholipid phosphatase
MFSVRLVDTLPSCIYVGVHWPADVAAGVILRLASGRAGFRLAFRRWRPARKIEQGETMPEETREVEYVS